MPAIRTIAPLIGPLRGPLALSGDVPASLAAARHLTASFFNPVDPPTIQVLGEVARTYLDALPAASRKMLPAKLRRRGLKLTIACEGNDPRPWRGLASALPAHEVVYALRRALMEQAPRRVVHGVLLDVHGTGVLLSGPAGAGKSELALELLSRGHALVADDAVELWRPARGIVLGRAPGLLQGYLEARGLGVLDVRRMHGHRALRAQQRLDLVVRLVPGRGRRLRAGERLSGRRGTRRLLGEPVPMLSLPAQTGHNLAALVEAAALDRRLRLDGIEPDAALARRQARAIKARS